MWKTIFRRTNATPKITFEDIHVLRPLRSLGPHPNIKVLWRYFLQTITPSQQVLAPSPIGGVTALGPENSDLPNTYNDFTAAGSKNERDYPSDDSSISSKGFNRDTVIGTSVGIQREKRWMIYRTKDKGLFRTYTYIDVVCCPSTGAYPNCMDGERFNYEMDRFSRCGSVSC